MADASDAGQAPSAQGTLEARPLSHLLVYLRTRRLSGRLVLRAPDGRGGAIAVWRGQATAARTAPPIAFFGAVAAEMGLVDRATVETTLREAAERRCLHGEVLIARGKLTAAQRDAVLVEQTCRKIQQMFTFPPPSAFAFYEDAPGTIEPPGAVDPVAPLWRGLRGAALSEGRELLAPFVAGAGLKIVNEGPIARAAFSKDEKEICEALAMRPMTLAQLQATFPSTPPERIDRLVYLLLLTKCAEPTSMSTAAMPRANLRRGGSMTEEEIAAVLKGSLRPATSTQAPPSPSSPPPPPQAVVRASPRISVPPAGPTKPVVGPVDAGATAIRVRADTVEDEDPFVTLGLRDGAPVEEARAAYIRLVKVWHPDRLAAELEPVRAEVGKIFTQMTQAHQTLTDADARRAFLARRDQRAAVLTRPRKDVLRLIDMALGKKDWPFATDEAKKLVARDADDAEAHAVLAWVASSASEGPDSAVRAALPILDRSLNRDTGCVRAHFYRAMIHKRLGNFANAYRDFARVVALDPKHVDATREVRIYEMRMKKK
jgi:curved DNA-binding protein CbpA